MSGQLPKADLARKSNRKVIRRFDHVYVVAQFYPWFHFCYCCYCFFFGMVVYDKDF